MIFHLLVRLRRRRNRPCFVVSVDPIATTTPDVHHHCAQTALSVLVADIVSLHHKQSMRLAAIPVLLVVLEEATVLRRVVA
jgi:hypothetical protein